MKAKEYYNSTRMVETRHWTLDMVMNFAEEYYEAWTKALTIHSVVGQNEQLVCPNCKSEHIGTSTHKGFFQGYCFVCNNHWAK